jgi:hypothetical protein
MIMDHRSFPDEWRVEIAIFIVVDRKTLEAPAALPGFSFIREFASGLPFRYTRPGIRIIPR